MPLSTIITTLLSRLAGYLHLVRWSQLMTQNDVVFIGSMPEFYDRHLGALFFQPPGAVETRK